MKQLLLVLFLLLPHPSILLDSKLKIRLEIIAAVTFNGQANESGLKEALFMLTEKFEIDQEYARMALLDYDGIVMHRTGLTDDRKKVVNTIKDIQKRESQSKSHFRKALEEMLEISKANGRTDALKLFLVITHRWPTNGDGTSYEFSEALPISKEINSAGLFFIVFDYYPWPPEQAVIDYFKQLCGEQNLFALFALQGIIEKIESTLIPKVLARACEHRERRCYFADSSTRTCQSVWHYPDGYLTNEECQERRKNDESPDVCKVQECHELCDKLWLWQRNTSSICVCGDEISRQGNPPFPELSLCPKVIKCTPCTETVSYGSSSIDSTRPFVNDTISNPLSDEGLATWTIALIVAIFLISIGGIIFALTKPDKRDAISKSTQVQPKRKVINTRKSRQRNVRGHRSVNNSKQRTKGSSAKKSSDSSGR